MNKREKTLAITVGLLVAVLGGLYVLNQVTTAFQTRLSKLSQLRGDLSGQANVISVGMRTVEKLADYERRSLPDNREKAHWLYQTWLIEQLEDKKLANVNVNPLRGYAVQDDYFLHSFTVTAEGNLKQMVEFLHAFYDVDYLHRIKSFNLKPLGDAKKLSTSMTIEAIALPTAPDRDALEYSKGDRLTHDDVDEYASVILNRNLFGPPNNEPLLLVRSSYEATLNEPFTLQVEAEDRDDDDLSYDANLEELPDARFDERAGELRWTPKQLGEYFVTVFAKDTGLPQKAASREVKITVVDPPPPEPKSTPEPPRFDLAKFSFVTAILSIDDTPQVWVHVRPLGKTLKLQKGDTFDLEGVSGKIQDIRSNEVQFELGDELRVVELGENLREGRTVGGE